jgi:hypothetical protein
VTSFFEATTSIVPESAVYCNARLVQGRAKEQFVSSIMLTRRDIPSVVTDYMDAHVVRDVERAIPLFLPDATVTDERTVRSGTDAIRTWIETGAAEFTFTTTETGYALPAPDHVQIFARIEGDFPGGVADIVYDFQLRDGKIARIVID